MCVEMEKQVNVCVYVEDKCQSWVSDINQMVLGLP